MDYDLAVISQPGYFQEIVVLEGVGTGHTTFVIDLYWGGESVREVAIDVYVGEQPGLSVS